VDFKQTLIIMTSNMGAERIQAHSRRKESFADLREDVMRIVRSQLRPEFVNRIDEIIVFRALTREQIADVARLLLEQTQRRLHAQEIEVEFTDAAVELIADEGYDPEFGARPLRRVIPASSLSTRRCMVLGGSLKPGDKVIAGAEDGLLPLDVHEGAATIPDETAEDEETRETAPD
jgi:ATP-dependent Clp protease ATP-binding subunit ClpC